MSKEIPAELIDALLTLGCEDKLSVQNKVELIASVKKAESIIGSYAPEDWQGLCETFSRDHCVCLFRGVVFGAVLAWGPSLTVPVNAVFSAVNRRCWPDTVYGLIQWAKDICEFHKFNPEGYVFAEMLQNQ